MTDDTTLPLFDLPDVRIPMPDGLHLSARLWRPATDARVPVIVEAIPYRKRDGTLVRDEGVHPWWAARGYACLRVDLRGSGDSEGLLEDEYTAQELADCCAVIAWAAEQGWCSGRVGMMGKSWGAFNALQVAALRPPALGAVIAVCGTVDRFADDIHFKGGCLMGENFRWGATMLSYQSRPPDPVLRPDWRDLWQARLRDLPFLAPRWAWEQARGAYWRHGSVCEDFAAIRVPVLAFGGWADGYMNMVPALVEHLQVPAKGIVGPWVHLYPHQAVPGPCIGFLTEGLRWWDRWLKEVPNGAENDPPLRLWVQHPAAPDPSAVHRPGQWIAEPAWPSPRVTPARWGLAADGLAPGPGRALAVRIATPQHLGLYGGAYFPTGLNAEMPADQRPDDAMSVCFDSAPLAEDLDLVGVATLDVTVTAEAPRARLVARLCDVAPDGASRRIALAVLNLCHRDDPADPADVPVGRPLSLRLAFDQCAHRLGAGHRLRLALSTTYWPLLWPGPGTGALVLLGGELALPVHAGAGAGEWTPPPPEDLPAAAVTALSPPRATRRIEHDLIAGTVTLVIEDAPGACRFDSHGLTVEDRSTERWTIHPDDPLSASAVIDWHQRLSRPGWEVTTDARCDMSAGAAQMVMHAGLVARQGGKTVADRTWVEIVPRLWT